MAAKKGKKTKGKGKAVKAISKGKKVCEFC